MRQLFQRLVTPEGTRAVLSRDEIMQAMRGIDADIYSRAIDVMISRLRQRLARPDLIHFSQSGMKP